MYGIGMQELLLILLIVVVIFGAKKLPEIGGGLGRAGAVAVARDHIAAWGTSQDAPLKREPS